MARSKKEIDKELMYQKILPTANQGTRERKQPAATMVDPILFPQRQAEPAAEPPKPVEQPAPIAPEPQPPVVEIPAAEPPAPEPKEPQLVNLMEGFVSSRIDEVMQKFNCCSCERCRRDILAMALNKLPPLYVLEDDLNLRDQKEKERSADVAAALVKSVLAIKAHPNH